MRSRARMRSRAPSSLGASTRICSSIAAASSAGRSDAA
jgi:hypothetical protein